MAIRGVKFHGCGASLAQAHKRTIPSHNRFGIQLRTPCSSIPAAALHQALVLGFQDGTTRTRLRRSP
jgi:hypothetical protein